MKLMNAYVYALTGGRLFCGKWDKNLEKKTDPNLFLWIPQNKITTLLGGLEPPTFRLTAERANQLRHKSSVSTYSKVLKILASCFKYFGSCTWYNDSMK